MIWSGVRNGTGLPSSLWSVRKPICFLIHRILKFQDSQLHMCINTKPNGKQKWSEESRKITFWLISHQATLILQACAQTINQLRKSKRSVFLLRRQLPGSSQKFLQKICQKTSLSEKNLYFIYHTPTSLTYCSNKEKQNKMATFL